jgi:hypothetical protein
MGEKWTATYVPELGDYISYLGESYVISEVHPGWVNAKLMDTSLSPNHGGHGTTVISLSLENVFKYRRELVGTPEEALASQERRFGTPKVVAVVPRETTASDMPSREHIAAQIDQPAPYVGATVVYWPGSDGKTLRTMEAWPHYVPGDPVAAIVTRVDKQHPNNAYLQVFVPCHTGVLFQPDVPFSPTPKPGYWSWPGTSTAR